MNLLATLSSDQQKPLGEMEWYHTVVPLISLTLKDANITPLMTSGDLLKLILDLPPDLRVTVLAVNVPDQGASEEEIQEVKQESHRGMLVGISGIFVIISFIALSIFLAYTEIEGKEVNKETTKMFWEMVKEVAGMLAQ